jgi:hypothetical protein
MTPSPVSTEGPMSHRQLSRGSWLAVAVAALALVVVIGALIPTIRDVLSPGPKTAAEAEQDQERRIDQQAERLEKHLALARGRSMFVVPPPPNALAEGEAAEEEAEQVAEGPAPKPTRYGGPDPIAIIYNTVWFSDSSMVAVGKERSGIRVVSVDGAPWSVRLRWREVEFDVPIFENTTPSFLQQKSESRGRP